MMKWIRWSGFAGFIIVISLIAALWLFAFGPLMKIAVENYGSEAVGAQVNVEDISLGFSPLSLTITGVQIADKDAPMENMISFDTAVATLEPFPLLLGHIVIPDIQLSGVELGSVRRYSGALTLEVTEQNIEIDNPTDAIPDTDATDVDNDTDNEAIPSVDEIFERETLLTSLHGEALDNAYKLHKKEIDIAVSNLPNEKVLKKYESDLNGLLKGKFKSVDDFKQRKMEFETLKAQFKKDKQAIADVNNVIKAGKSDLEQKWLLLKDAPKQDLANLKGKYTLDGAGVSNLAALLFGDDVGGYAETALGYYEKVRPLLVDDETQAEKQALLDKRLNGRFVHFKSDNPLPDFWIKTLSFTMALPELPKDTGSMGQVAVNVQDITLQQEVINAPIKLLVTGQNLKDMESLRLTGVLDHRSSIGTDTFDLDVIGWRLSEIKLGLVGLKLVSSNTSVQGNVVFTKGDMNLVANGLFEQTSFDSKDRSLVAKEMVAALKNVNQFTVTAGVEGRITSPDVSLKSDLDNQLNKAFDKRIKQKQAELESELKAKLNEQLLAYGGKYTEQLKQLNLTEGSLKEKGKAIGKLGKAKISSYDDQLKAELAEKEAELKAKADAEELRLKEKLEAEKAKLKVEAEEKRKELERKAKEKLKKIFG